MVMVMAMVMAMACEMLWEWNELWRRGEERGWDEWVFDLWDAM